MAGQAQSLAFTCRPLALSGGHRLGQLWSLRLRREAVGILLTDPAEASMPDVTPWYQSRTILTAVIMMVLSVLEWSGVRVGDFPLDRVIDGLLALGTIYIAYLRLEPSVPKPLTQAQASVLLSSAKRIVRDGNL
jgi:hypothetical protein